jgi:hypothetical protein
MKTIINTLYQRACHYAQLWGFTFQEKHSQPEGLPEISRVVESRPPGSISNRPAPWTGARISRDVVPHL